MAAVYKRGQVWWVRFRFNGIHVRRSAKTTKKAEAQAYLLRLMEEYGQAARGGATQRYKISDAIVRFFEETSLKPGTIAGYKSHARIVCRLFGEAHLDEVHRQRLADFIAQRKRTGVADASIRRDLAFLSSVFNQAIRWGWLEMSPFKDFSFRSLKLGRPRTRFLTREEYNQLYLASSATLKPILLLAVETGLRKDELLGLKVSNIDLRRRELQLEETKTDTPRRVPLSPTAVETIRGLLEQRARPRSVYLFCKADGSRAGNPRKAFEGACRRAGIDDFRWHDLRHTFASWWVQEGGDLYRLSRVLGHTTIQMSSRYAHLRTDDLHDELERVAQKRTQARIIPGDDPAPEA